MPAVAFSAALNLPKTLIVSTNSGLIDLLSKSIPELLAQIINHQNTVHTSKSIKYEHYPFNRI